ncbi:MAG: methyltransferase domain-containing protein [Actinomycetota bacterium]|nr:methyltransferase domain-containing protein [Actinomycetota bacterium]
MARLSGLAGRGLSRLADLGRATTLDERGDRETYELHASTYDFTSAIGAVLRARAVEALAPCPHEVIFDAGCGTGLNFAPIEQGIGRRGRLVGIDHSPAMLRRAGERLGRGGWHNVTLVSSAADVAALGVKADGVLFCLAHDILRSPHDLARILAQVRPGGRIVAAGSKWAPLWAMPINVATWFVNLPFITSFEGFEQPWGHLARFVPGLHVESLQEYFGGAYVATGTTPAVGGAISDR